MCMCLSVCICTMCGDKPTDIRVTLDPPELLATTMMLKILIAVYVLNH